MGAIKMPLAEAVSLTLSRAQQAGALTVDEVDSGTGIGTQMNAVEDVLKAWTGPKVTVRVDYLAVGRSGRPEEQLEATISKWSPEIVYGQATLVVNFVRVTGHLIAYDNDELLGLARTRGGGYRVIKREGVTITAQCPCCCHADCFLALATAGTQNESIANIAHAVASARQTPPIRSLDAAVARRGCTTCRSFWGALRGVDVEPVRLVWRDHLSELRRRLCRFLTSCGHRQHSRSA